MNREHGQQRNNCTYTRPQTTFSCSFQFQWRSIIVLCGPEKINAGRCEDVTVGSTPKIRSNLCINNCEMWRHKCRMTGNPRDA